METPKTGERWERERGGQREQVMELEGSGALLAAREKKGFSQIKEARQAS